MKFKAGDLVEVSCPKEHIFGLVPANRGTVIGYVGVLNPRYGEALQRGVWYAVNFGGTPCYALEGALRLIPGDDSRNVGDWNKCVWAPKHVRLQKFREFMDRQLERA